VVVAFTKICKLNKRRDKIENPAVPFSASNVHPEFNSTPFGTSENKKRDRKSLVWHPKRLSFVTKGE